MSQTSSQLTEKIIDCTESFQSFNSHAPLILKDIFSNPYANFKPFLVVIYRILEEKEETAVNKFYALYLLVWIIEKNPSDDFIESLFENRDLTNILFNAAQFDLDNGTRVSERGRTYFSARPQTDEAIIGINFVRLSLEFLLYAKQLLEEKRSNYTFSSYLLPIDDMTRGRELPAKNWFVGIQQNPNIELAIHNFASPSSSGTRPIGNPDPDIKIQNYPKLNSCQIQNDVDSPNSASKKAQQQRTERSGGVEEYRKASIPNPILRQQQQDYSRSNSGRSAFENTPSADPRKKKTLGERMAEQGIFALDDRKTPRNLPQVERSNSNLRTRRTPGQEPQSPLNKSNSTQEIRDFFNSRQKPQQTAKKQAGTITQVWEPMGGERQDTDRILQGANQYGYDYEPEQYNKPNNDRDKNFEAPKKSGHVVQGGNYSGQGQEDYERDLQLQKENEFLKEKIREMELELAEMNKNNNAADQELLRENTFLKNKLADLVQKTEGLNNTIKGLVDENCKLSDSLQLKDKEIEDLKKSKQPVVNPTPPTQKIPEFSSARQPYTSATMEPYSNKANPEPKKQVTIDNYDRPLPEASSPNNFYVSSVKQPDSGSEIPLKQGFKVFQAGPMEESQPYISGHNEEMYKPKPQPPQIQQQFGSDGKKQIIVDNYNYPPGQGYSYSGNASSGTQKKHEDYGGVQGEVKGYLQEPQQSAEDLYGQAAGGKKKLFERVTYEKPRMVLTAKDYGL